MSLCGMDGVQVFFLRFPQLAHCLRVAAGSALVAHLYLQGFECVAEFVELRAHIKSFKDRRADQQGETDKDG